MPGFRLVGRDKIGFDMYADLDDDKYNDFRHNGKNGKVADSKRSKQQSNLTRREPPEHVKEYRQNKRRRDEERNRKNGRKNLEGYYQLHPVAEFEEAKNYFQTEFGFPFEPIKDEFDLKYAEKWYNGRPCFAITERDGAGEVEVGVALRYLERTLELPIPLDKEGNEFPSKQTHGCYIPEKHNRGLIIPNGLRDKNKLEREIAHQLETGRLLGLFVVEGLSDTMAMRADGFLVIGRPSNIGGKEDIAAFVKQHVPRDVPIVIVGENDERIKDGIHLFPGNEGVDEVGQFVARQLRRSRHKVYKLMPPAGTKDYREWFLTRAPGEDASTFYAYCLENSVVEDPKARTEKELAEEEARTKELNEKWRHRHHEAMKRLQAEEEARDREAAKLMGDLIAPEAIAALEEATDEMRERRRLSNEAEERAQRAAKKDEAYLSSLERNSGCGVWIPQVATSVDSNYGHAIQIRCWCWSCEFCREMNSRVHKEHVVGLTARETEFYTALIYKEDFAARKKQIERAHGDYVAIKQPGETIFIMASCWIKGAHQEKGQPAAAEEAIRRAHDAIDQIPHDFEGDAISHSKPWAFDRKKDRKGMITLGPGSTLTKFKEFVERFKGVSTKGQIEANQKKGESVTAKFVFELPEFSSQVFKDRAIRNLSALWRYNHDIFNDPEDFYVPASGNLLQPLPQFVADYLNWEWTGSLNTSDDTEQVESHPAREVETVSQEQIEDIWKTPGYWLPNSAPV